MGKKISMSAKVRRMVEAGHTNKEIIDKLKVKPGLVYNVRYNMAKAEREGTGINALTGTVTVKLPTPPKKRGRPRKVVAADHPPYMIYPPKAVKQVPYESLIPTQSRSFWQRVKDWLFGVA